MPSKFYQYADLIRLGVPTGYLLAFFPAAFGIMLAAQELADLLYIPLFFIGAVFSRGAGCIINDLYDRRLDKHVERTMHRPLASGAVSIKEALTLLIFMLAVCLAILFSLTITAIIVGFIAFFMILLYPLMKRITYFPQIFLGITFNLGCLIGYAAIADEIGISAMLVYVGCGFWTLGYDTIYAFSDIKDDKKVGIKSTAIFFEKKNYRWWITLFYLISVILFALAGLLAGNYISILGSLICFYMLRLQIKKMDVTDPATCIWGFRHNNWVGLVLLIFMLVDFFAKSTGIV